MKQNASRIKTHFAETYLNLRYVFNLIPIMLFTTIKVSNSGHLFLG